MSFPKFLIFSESNGLSKKMLIFLMYRTESFQYKKLSLRLINGIKSIFKSSNWITSKHSLTLWPTTWIICFKMVFRCSSSLFSILLTSTSLTPNAISLNLFRKFFILFGLMARCLRPRRKSCSSTKWDTLTSNSKYGLSTISQEKSSLSVTNSLWTSTKYRKQADTQNVLQWQMCTVTKSCTTKEVYIWILVCFFLIRNFLKCLVISSSFLLSAPIDIVGLNLCVFLEWCPNFSPSNGKFFHQILTDTTFS
jgi:hypothetical protein